VFSVSCLHIGQRELTSPFLANFALCSCRVSVPVASFTLTAAIVTANGIALRQLALKGQNSDSWFSKLDEISEKHSVNLSHDLGN
jgi:hypothetical protein